ncbi:hypothetical protein HZ326_1737 [Fusarium oxysporum f. sp. albedinis]|nr:hypothetical protein HZ326_1737 [Fusarium oxysporum f. sp. albedinis]
MKDVIRDSKSMSLGVSVLLLAINGFMRAIYLLQQSFQLNIHDIGLLHLYPLREMCRCWIGQIISRGRPLGIAF